MNLAHYFTFLRIFVVPFFSIIYLGYEYLHIPATLVPYLLLILLAICEFTDIMDGFIARKRNQVTDFGKIIDPLADSITHIAIFMTFTKGWVSVPVLLVFVFLYREMLVSGLRTVCALRGHALAARKTGKVKSFIQAVVSFFIVIMMIPFTLGYISISMLKQISFASISIAAIYSALTGIEYFYVNRGFIKKVLMK